MKQAHPLQRLRIVEQPPPHVFLEQWFSFVLVLENQGVADIPDRTFSDVDRLTLRTNLQLNYGPMPRIGSCDATLAKLVIASSTSPQKVISDFKTGNTSTMRCKVEGMISGDAPVNVTIKILLVSNDITLSYVNTNPIHLVKYKLGIDPYDWEDVWYKDEGGWDNGMIARVYLRQMDGSLALGQPIPLRVTIHYDDDEATLVDDQSILRMLGATAQIIDKDTAMATLKFRVEDLSINHNGHDFKLLIAADFTIFNVAPAFSPEFNVRSQPYKKQRRHATCESTVITSRSQDKIELTASSSFGRHQDKNTQQQTTYDCRSTADESDTVHLRVARSALLNILDWADQVVSNLHSIKWNVMGYESNPNGTIDYSTPIFDSQNPNEAIAEILSTFSSTVQDDLKMLLSSVTKSQQVNTSPDNIQASISKPISYTKGNSRDLESQFTYLHVEKYCSIRTKKVLGYPAFDEDRCLIGFFNHLTPSIMADQFIAIEHLSDDFDKSTDQEEVTHFLKDAMGCRSKAVYCITNYDSLQSLLETASANTTQ